jgi:cell division protein FtsQ
LLEVGRAPGGTWRELTAEAFGASPDFARPLDQDRPLAPAWPGRRKPSRGWRARRLPLIGVSLAAMLAIVAISEGGRGWRRMIDIDAAAALAGFGIDQVTLSGHQFTADTDVFDALDLENARSMASFDASAVRARLERLPWIATAELTRVFPGGLDVKIAERKPFAVWARGERRYLIDRSGRLLSPVSATAALDLPRVAGEGAAAEAEGLLALVQRYPSVARRLEEAERVAERRWTLKLSRAVTLVLPADREAAVLEEIEKGGELARLVAGENAIIDLRRQGRITVRAQKSQEPPRS